ncbi:MAG: hypothetical protein IPO94_04915 [Saprospiraceae bacterium]|nr:hypothetical protein [Saprospiraceae bacterium]
MGDNNPHTITICSGGIAPGTLTIVTGDNAIVTSVNVNGAPHVTGIVRTEGSFIANGGQIETGTLLNTGTTTQVIIYTVCPYSFGPDGIDNGAMGDDCVAVAGADDNGLTDGVIGSCVTYTVTILPTPEQDDI